MEDCVERKYFCVSFVRHSPNGEDLADRLSIPPWWRDQLTALAGPHPRAYILAVEMGDKIGEAAISVEIVPTSRGVGEIGIIITFGWSVLIFVMFVLLLFGTDWVYL